VDKHFISQYVFELQPVLRCYIMLITLFSFRTSMIVSIHGGLYHCKVGVLCTVWALSYFTISDNYIMSF